MPRPRDDDPNASDSDMSVLMEPKHPAHHASKGKENAAPSRSAMGEKEKERKRKKVVAEENVEGLEEEGHEVVVEGQAGVGQHQDTSRAFKVASMASSSSSSSSSRPLASSTTTGTATKARPTPSSKKPPPPAPGPSNFIEAASTGAVKGGGDDVQLLKAQLKSLRRTVDELERLNAEMTEERDASIADKETYIKQFDELSKLRTTKAESGAKAYRETAEQRAEAQRQLIDKTNDLLNKERKKNETLQAKLDKLATADLGSTTASSSKTVKELEKTVAAQGKEMKKLEETLVQRERELALEVEQSRKLLAAAPSASSLPLSSSTNTASFSAATAVALEEAKHQLTLYEDLTHLHVSSVSVGPEGAHGKEVTWTCDYSANNRSLAFKIRSAYQPAPKSSSSSSASKPIHILLYTPLSLEHESEEYRAELGFFSESFTIEWDKADQMWRQMEIRVGGEEEEEDVEEGEE